MHLHLRSRKPQQYNSFLFSALVSPPPMMIGRNAAQTQLGFPRWPSLTQRCVIWQPNGPRQPFWQPNAQRVRLVVSEAI